VSKARDELSTLWERLQPRRGLPWELLTGKPFAAEAAPTVGLDPLGALMQAAVALLTPHSSALTPRLRSLLAPPHSFLVPPHSFLPHYTVRSLAPARSDR